MTTWVEAIELERVDPYLILCPDVDSSLRLLLKFPDMIQPTMDLISSLMKLDVAKRVSSLSFHPLFQKTRWHELIRSLGDRALVILLKHITSAFR